MRQMAGSGKHLIVMLDVHLLDIRAQRSPETLDEQQRFAVHAVWRREDYLVAAKQPAVGSGNPAALGAGNRMSRDEAHRHAAKRLAGCAQHIALGAANVGEHRVAQIEGGQLGEHLLQSQDRDRKSTRLNSSHVKISYAVFCLKKKKTNNIHIVSFQEWHIQKQYNAYLKSTQ